MVRRFTWLLVFVLLFAADASGQSRQPPPQQGAAEGEIDEADSDQSGASKGGNTATTGNDQPAAGNDTTSGQQQIQPGLLERMTADPALALLTFGLLFFAAWQVRISRDVARRQLRSYMSMQHVTISGLDDPQSKEVVIHAKVKNCGATPAHDVVHAMSTRLKPAGFNDFVHVPMDALSRTVVGPGGTLESECRISAQAFRAHLAQIREGQFVFFAFGTVTYKDAFDQPRITRYRVQLRPDEVKDGLLPACAEGNEAD